MKRIIFGSVKQFETGKKERDLFKDNFMHKWTDSSRITYAAKTELTFEQRPSAYRDQHFGVPFSTFIA
jgi:hypothetical protein